MKKFIAALIAVVMVVSCMSFAFGATVKTWTMGQQNETRWSVAIGAAVAEGDKISFWVKPGSVDGVSMYARNSARALYLDADGEYVLDGDGNPYEVYSGKYIADYAIAVSEDGWYYIVCEAQDAADAGVYELSVDQATTPSQLAGVKVNGVEVDVVAFKSNPAPEAGDAMEEPVAAVEEETEEETEDVTTEETGVVSVAVVAVAAVIGGAVVLKKREF